VHRVPKEYRDLAPKVIQLEGGGEALFIEGQPLRMVHRRALGLAERQIGSVGGSYESNDGAGSPEQRLREQDLDGVDAEVLYAGVDGGLNFIRAGIKDDEAYAGVIRGYNDWLAEEYCAAAPDRLIPLGVLPEVDAPTAVAEMEHCARLGMKGVQLNTFPAGKMLPTPEDNLFWAAAVEMDMPLSIHDCLQFESGVTYNGPLLQYTKTPGGAVPATTRGDPIRRVTTSYGYRPSESVMQFIFAGVLDQFPTLQIYIAETQIGWLPMWLQQVDLAYERSHWSMHEHYGLPQLERTPSEYIKDHFLWGFMKDPFGVRQRHEIGVDKVMWETDFPHTGTDWPHSQDTIEMNFAGVPEDERYKMLAGNAVKFFHLDEA